METIYHDPSVQGVILVRCFECGQLTYDPRTRMCLGVRDCDLCGAQWICEDQFCECSDPHENPWAD